MEFNTASGIESEGDRSPLVSIITVSHNAKQELATVLESVWALKDEDLELIVVDGGSCDGTAAYLKKHQHAIDYWISEPDSGIYDAMNKAIAKARGTFLLHLNAGDRLLRVPKRELREAYAQGIDVAAFRVSIDGREEFHPSSGFWLRFTNTLHHQGTYFRRTSFLPYDLRYKVFADFDVNQRLSLAGAQIKTFKSVTSLHAAGGISNRNTRQTAAEFFAVVQGNYGRRAVPVVWILAKWRGLRDRMARR